MSKKLNMKTKFKTRKLKPQSQNLELEFMPTFLTNPYKIDKLNMNTLYI